MSSIVGAKPSTEGHELFVGLVGSIGTDMSRVSGTILETLRNFGYAGEEIRLSHLLHGYRNYSILPTTPMDAYYETHMNGGNEFRRKIAFGGALAALAMLGIRKIRKSIAGEERNIMPRFAFILNSLKHPTEVRVLRSIYGQRFILFSAFTPRETRLKNLAERIAESRQRLNLDEFRSAAEHLVQRDDVEFDKFGQNVRGTFPRGDFFLDASELEELRKSTTRFLELFFGHPFHTPTRDEYGMFLAHAAALRSADLSRQVGAVICTAEGDVVAVGTNEVPKAGGGLYWEGDASDERDFRRGIEDPDYKMRRTVIAEVIQRLRNKKWLDASKNTIEKLTDEALGEEGFLKDSQVMDQVSFDRAVHAEMAALTDSARRTVTVKDCTLFTTTFPCHNCAKHIVASGIKRVVYIEPYPKSLAFKLHPDSISMEKRAGSTLTIFEPFVGVAPRRYFDLFSMRQRKDDQGHIIAWNAQKSQPRLGRTSPSYIEVEQLLVDWLIERAKTAGIETV